MNAISEKIIHYRPPRISMLLLILAATLQWALPQVRVVLLSSSVLAIFTAVSGFAIMIWAWWLFQKAETAICPTENSEVLVTSGIYRLTRNPMYLGLVLMMAGVALWFGTLPYYLATVLFFLVINQFFCPFEEQRLISTFGEQYSGYRRTVRRWV
jgi:protein-S-isoprenylcysteine O-methyltransferase Ste14